MENPDDFAKLGKEHVIVIMNHKHDIEWVMCWILSERLHVLGGTKIFGKASLKMLPLIGWAWTFTESIFLKRDWDKDKTIISRDLEFITQYPKNVYVTLLLFCEGTRFTEEKHKASNAIARKKGIPELKYHLLPRTKGFVHSINGLKGKMPAIIDMTINFNKEYAKPTLKSLVQGKTCQAEIYARRIPLENIPTDTDEACAEWLHQLYREKDEICDHFEKNGTYKIGTKFHLEKRPTDMIIWFLWAIVLSIPLVYYAIQIITSGSLALQLGAIVVCFLLYKGVIAMIDMSDSEKGSAYGKVKGKAD
jgi:lysophosphatidic acid acyltransferase/lysophosphatidylinositol acyltransferase